MVYNMTANPPRVLINDLISQFLDLQILGGL
jgi:hypothetical protein